MREIKRMIEDVVDQMKTDEKEVNVILVGGGSILVDPNWRLKGVEEVVMPPNFGCANAFGAATAQVSGTVDKIASFTPETKEKVREEFKQMAIKAAVDAGAIEGTIEVIPSDVPLSYMTGVSRMIYKAVGDLDCTTFKESGGMVEVDPTVLAGLVVDDKPFEEEVHEE